MTTDFTSATILGSKTTTANSEKLTVKTSGSADTNIFDSILSNASKSYTDKDISSKTNEFSSKDYAQNTKDLNSAKKYQEKTKSKEQTNCKKNTNSTIEKDSQNKKTENQIENKTKESNETLNEPVQKETNSNIKNEEKIESNQNNSINDESKNFAQNKENSQEHNSENQDFYKNEVTENELVQQEKITNNTIANEQILANVEIAEETKTLATNFAEKLLGLTPESELKNTIAETLQIEVSTPEQVSTAKTSEELLTLNKTVVSAEEQISIENTLKNIDLNQQKAQNQTTQVVQASEKLANTAAITNAINLATKDASQTEVLAQVNNTLTENLQNAGLEINTENLTQKSIDNLKQKIQQEVQQNTQQDIQESVLKTTKETLATDNSRIIANVENMTDLIQEEPIETKLTTPMETAEVEETQLPKIKVAESVAEQAKKQVISTVENKDIAGEIKSKATAKLGDLQGTSTVVNEVQTSVHQEQSQTQTNLGQQQNSAMTQSNAMEQAVKMSIEDISSVNSSDSFLNKLDAKLNASTKPLASQNALLNKTDILNQMNAKFNEMLQAGQNKVSVILQPENLGKVSVEIMNTKDGIVAKMTTDSQQVKELFDKNVEALKLNLSSQGVNVNNIKVECTQESANNAMNFEREQFNQNFNNSNNNNQTHQSKNQETTYSTEYGTNEEAQEDIEIETTSELKNTETIIQHNGKVDYKV